MKQPIPLATIIAAPRLTYFGDDSDPGGGGGAASEGGGGGDSNADLMSFTAPDIGNVADILAGKTEGDLNQPGTPPAKPEPPKAPEPPKTGEPPKPGGEPPAKQLRVELDAVKAERDQLKATLEKGDPKLVDAEKAVKAKETELAEHRKKIADYEQQLALADPAVTEKLRTMDQKYDADAGQFYGSVPELDQRAVNALVSEYHALPRNTPEYKTARLDFEKKVNEALGGTEDIEHRKLGKALDFIERTHEFAVERPTVEREISQSALKLRRESMTKTYQGQSQFVRTAIDRAKLIPENIAQTDPYHPRVMLDTFSKALPPEQVESFNKGIPEFIELVMAGVKPRGEEDYAGMTPQQIKDSQAEENSRYEAARGNAVDVMYNGLRALRMFPILVKEYQRLRAKVKEEGEGAPPDPTGGNRGGGGGGGDDIKEFRAPDLGAVNFS